MRIPRFSPRRVNGEPSPRRPAFGALKHRDFRLLWLGACVSFVGSWVQIVAAGWLVYDMTGSKQALGVVALAGGLPTTALMLFGGVIADRADKRRLILITQSVFALTAFTLALLLAVGALRLWHLVAGAAVNGLVFAIDGPARQAVIHDLVGPEDLSSGVALMSASFNAARVIGPIVGSLLYAGLGPAWCYFVNGISFAGILGAVLLIRTDISHRVESQSGVWGGFLEGMRHLKENRPMRSILSLTAFTSVFAFAAYTTLMPAIGRDMLRLPESRYGLLFTAIGLGSLAGAYLVGRAAASGTRGILLFGGAAGFGLSLLVFARTENLFLALLILFGIGLFAIAELATANTLTQTLAPESLRGRAVSAHMFAMAGLQPVGAFLAGAAAERWGLTAALTGGALIFLTFALILAVARPELIRLE